MIAQITPRFLATHALLPVDAKCVSHVLRIVVIDGLDGEIVVDRCGSFLQADIVANALNRMALKLRSEEIKVQLADLEYPVGEERLLRTEPETSTYQIEKSMELRSNSESNPEGCDDASAG